MNDRDRYEQYVQWCKRIGVKPAAFDEWRFQSSKISDRWTSIERLDMGRFA